MQILFSSLAKLFILKHFCQVQPKLKFNLAELSLILQFSTPTPTPTPTEKVKK